MTILFRILITILAGSLFLAGVAYLIYYIADENWYSTLKKISEVLLYIFFSIAILTAVATFIAFIWWI